MKKLKLTLALTVAALTLFGGAMSSMAATANSNAFSEEQTADGPAASGSQGYCDYHGYDCGLSYEEHNYGHRGGHRSEHRSSGRHHSGHC